MTLTKYETIICEECGEEYLRGILDWAFHRDRCKRNAPNCDIEAHEHEMERNKTRAADPVYLQRRKNLDEAVSKMTQEEQIELVCRTFCGLHVGDTVYMGSASMERLREYEDAMILKYCRR